MSVCLRDLIWRSKYMMIGIKTRIYKTTVRPIMTYGSEIRAETNTNTKLMSIVEMKTIRAIQGRMRN